MEPVEPVQPPAVDQSVTSDVPSSSLVATPAPTKNRRKPKLLLVIVAITALLVGGSVQAYFVVQNQPENIWKTALSRTAAGYDKLIAYDEKTKDLKSGTVKGGYKVTGDFITDGDIEAQYDEKNLSFKTDIGLVGNRITLEGRLIDSPNSASPDVYLKPGGLSSFGKLAPQYVSIISAYDNQWLAIDHTLFDNLPKGTVDAKSADLSRDDFTKIAVAVGKVNKDYLFTTDDKKAVLRVAKEIGKEKQDDRSVYHYQVGLNKAQTKDYVNAMIDTLEGTPVSKLTNGKKLRDMMNVTSIMKSIDGYKESNTADVYVDTTTKLIRTVRLIDTKNKENYVNLGFHYTGGNELPFVFGVHTSDNGLNVTANIAVTLNTKTNVTDFDVEVSGSKDSGTTQKLSVKLTQTPSNDKFTIQKPENAKSMNELLAPFLNGSLLGSNPTSATADSLLKI